ncbi:MAG: hypothetical protein ACJ8DI_11030 [Ktedonobacteraceae bacterium]
MMKKHSGYLLLIEHEAWVFSCVVALAFAVKIAVDAWFYSSVVRVKGDLERVDGFPGGGIRFGLGLYHMLSAPHRTCFERSGEARGGAVLSTGVYGVSISKPENCTLSPERKR